MVCTRASDTQTHLEKGQLDSIDRIYEPAAEGTIHQVVVAAYHDTESKCSINKITLIIVRVHYVLVISKSGAEIPCH